MDFTVVPTTGQKINKVPFSLRPESTIFLIQNPEFKDMKFEEKQNILKDYINNFDTGEFYRNIASTYKDNFLNYFENIKKEKREIPYLSADLMVMVLRANPENQYALDYSNMDEVVENNATQEAIIKLSEEHGLNKESNSKNKLSQKRKFVPPPPLPHDNEEPEKPKKKYGGPTPFGS